MRPRDPAGRLRRRLLAEELTELARLEARLKALTRELSAAVRTRGSHLMDIHGIGPIGAARILADVGDVARPTEPTSRPGPGPRFHAVGRRCRSSSGAA